MTDYPDYQTPAEHARQISVTGVPLLAQAATVYANPAVSVPANSSFASGTFPVNQTAYEIYISVGFPVAATVPFVEVTLQWGEPSGTVSMWADTYIIPGNTAAAGFLVRGRGPAKGSTVAVNIANLDAAQAASVNVRLLQHSRVAVRDDWRWNNGFNRSAVVPGWTLPVLPDDESVLGMEAAAAVAAGASVSWLCGMHNGLVNFGLDLGGGALANLVVQVAAEPAGSYVANNPIYGTVNPPPNFQVACPRSPVRFQLHNNGTTAVNVTWSAIRAD